MPRMNNTSGAVVRMGTSSGGGPGWQEVHSRVRELRRTFLHLSVKFPRNVTFRRLGPMTWRCYFLLSPSIGKESTLFYSDISLENSWVRRAVYHEVLDPTQSFLFRRTSREEQLLSERRRIASWGITDYEIHPASGTIVFPASSSVFQCTHPEVPIGPVNPQELPSIQVRLNPQICPSDPTILAFAAQNDIYLLNTRTGEEKRATFVHSGTGRLEYDAKMAGMPSYVMQEEFSRYLGYWWQPLSTDGVLRLLYEEVDEDEVPIVQFISSDDSGTLEEFRFPRAGMPNAKSTLRLLEVELNSDDKMCLTTRYLRHELAALASWHEYLVRVGWMSQGMGVWCQLLDRRQQRLDLIVLPLECFTDSRVASSDSPGGGCFTPQVILSQRSNTWVDVHNLLYWWQDQTEPGQQRLIWASEETGHRHLYFHQVQLTPSNHETACDHHELVTVQSEKIVMLTSGEWSVTGGGLWVDERRGLVYFTGLHDTPLEVHLYVVSINHPGLLQRLTCAGYSHQVTVNEDCSLFTTVFSNIETPSQSQVFRLIPLETPDITGQMVTSVQLGDLIQEPMSEELIKIRSLVIPEVFQTEIESGDVLYAMVFKPHNFVAGRKYPTVLSIYGGPQVQLVTNSFKGFRHMRNHMLAANGFCVVSIDSRGSDNRGVNFQSHIMNRMGTVEVQDQVEVLRYLESQCDYLDLTRLAVTGWSYGGYLSLMALAQHPQLFKIAIAGAPVVSWQLYDTGYTERYMDVPSINADGYRNSSVLSYVNSFPDEENRLLIVQGMIDENVHFAHTNQLIQALVKAGKPYQLQIFPHERHCLRQLDSNEHYETKLLSFLLQHL